MPEFENVEWAGWMEEGLRTMLRLGPRCIGMCAILPEGEVFTGYYECTCADKVQMAGQIQMDATLDMLEANRDTLRQMLDETAAAENFEDWDALFEDGGE